MIAKVFMVICYAYAFPKKSYVTYKNTYYDVFKFVDNNQTFSSTLNDLKHIAKYVISKSF